MAKTETKPQIFEIFGFPITDKSPPAHESRRAAYCPFMRLDCDGGGNRYLSDVELSTKPTLREYFRSRESVRAGVCSIQLSEGEAPWIVCPRRLMALVGGAEEGTNYQELSRDRLLRLLGYPSGTKLGVWSEVKLKFDEDLDGKTKRFDYTFDYILVPIGRVSETQLAEMTGMSWKNLKRKLEKGGFTIARRGGEDYVEDFPNGVPCIVEVMTSSTSGGDRKKESTIPLAFENAILGKPHRAPGINFRQVWARMVSQLIVKTEVAMGWGGKAIWLVQDHLVHYISETTALDINAFMTRHPSEVNMLSFSYGKSWSQSTGVIQLMAEDFYAGPIRGDTNGNIERKPSFQDMVHAPMQPASWRLFSRLAQKKRINVLTVH